MTLVKVNNPAARSLDGFVNDFFNELPSFGRKFREDVFNFPPVNIVEKTNNYQLEVSVPGFDKADFNVKLDGNLLTISAKAKEITKEETDKVVRKEFSSKSFKRSFTVDDKIDAAAIEAKYENGILTVTLPKIEQAKAISKEIAIQ